MEKEFDFQKLYNRIYADWSYGSGFDIELENIALVIVDMQPALTSSKTGMGKAFGFFLNVSLDYFEERIQNTVLPNTARLIDYFRKNNMMVVYVVTWSETQDLSDMPRYQRRSIERWEKALGEQVYRKWNAGMHVYDEIAPKDTELVIPKRTGSAFASSVLDSCLRNAGIRQIVATGCNTNGCYFETLVVGSNFGYELIMANDATACFDPVLQDEAEAWIGRHFATVRTTQETIDLLAAAKRKA